MVSIFSFSPPTRGWPGVRIVQMHHRAVFPAHAGMARITWPDFGSSEGFPRPRGDGP